MLRPNFKSIIKFFVIFGLNFSESHFLDFSTRLFKRRPSFKGVIEFFVAFRLNFSKSHIYDFSTGFFKRRPSFKSIIEFFVVFRLSLFESHISNLFRSAFFVDLRPFFKSRAKFVLFFESQSPFTRSKFILVI
jgi:hypothetical protein